MAPLDSPRPAAAQPVQPPGAARPRRRRHPWLIALGVLCVAIVLLVVFWDWNWFRPFVEARASAAIGRKVTIRNLAVHLSRMPEVVLDGVAVANPDGFPADSHFATVERLSVTLDAMAYLHTRDIVIPAIVVTKPVIDAEQRDDGSATWDFKLPSGGGGKQPKIGNLQITDGHAQVVIPKLKADFKLDVATQDGGSAGGQIVVAGDGTYAQQPITLRLIGGAVLSLRDAATPYPIDLQVANGPTHVKLNGTVDDPLAFAGTHLKLDLSGPDMALLLPLIGIALPKTPSYDVAGDLAYVDKKIRFDNIAGRVGASDLEGSVAVDPPRDGGPPRTLVDAALTSRKVDLADLGGFIGSEPGRVGTPNQTAEQKQAVQKAEASSQWLPTKDHQPAEADRRRRPPEIPCRQHCRPVDAARRRDADAGHR